MSHTEAVRIVDGADTAVLFIHGILGTPNHFREFLPLVPQSFSYINLLLDGHGKDVLSFANTSMQKWHSQVDNAVDELAKNHKKIIIVAHSMGALLALWQAYKKPELISKMILLSVPLKLSLKPQLFLTAFKIYFNLIKPDDYRGIAAKNAYSIEDDWRIWRYFGWIKRYRELFAEIKRTAKICNVLPTPCQFYQSAEDEIVSLKACRLLKNSNFKVDILENSAHYYYDSNDFKRMLQEIETIFKN